jgi:hypothetical protein
MAACSGTSPACSPPAPPVAQPEPPATQRVAVAGKPRVKGGKVKVRVTLAQPGGFHAVLRLRGKAVRKLGRKSRALTLVVTAGSATRTVVVAPR